MATSSEITDHAAPPMPTVVADGMVSAAVGSTIIEPMAIPRRLKRTMMLSAVMEPAIMAPQEIRRTIVAPPAALTDE